LRGPFRKAAQSQGNTISPPSSISVSPTLTT
jgi:hypothetical protein